MDGLELIDELPHPPALARPACECCVAILDRSFIAIRRDDAGKKMRGSCTRQLLLFLLQLATPRE